MDQSVNGQPSAEDGSGCALLDVSTKIYEHCSRGAKNSCAPGLRVM